MTHAVLDTDHAIADAAVPARGPAWDVRTSLTLSGFDCDPDDLSTRLGLEPHHVVRRGGSSWLMWQRPDAPARNEWVWRPDADLPAERPARIGLADLLRPLCRALTERRDAFADLPGCRGAIRIEILPHDALPAIDLDAGDLAALADLGLDWSVDLQTVTH
jgi:hypothetical protein